MALDKKHKTTVLVGHIEGISYLLLLFVAMPLKYMMDMPVAVRIMGTIHGFLFVAYFYFLIESLGKKRFNVKTAIALFIMSLLPFGTFFQEKLIKALN